MAPTLLPTQTYLPLLPDAPGDSLLAYRKTQPVTRAEFLGHVQGVAEKLPLGAPVLNLCADRYWFAVSLFAAIARGNNSLLPNSSAPEHLAAVAATLPNPICLNDQPTATLGHLPNVRVDAVPPQASSWVEKIPQIPFGQRIATVFTSGSTGVPQAHHKTFGRLQHCAEQARKRLWAAAGGPCTVLGTVPFRHMYGLDLTVLLPLLGGTRLSSRMPFFPADIAAALAELPARRLLVTTPFHLRTLLNAEIDLPPIAAVLSATAPLSLDLAARAESMLGAPVLEIFGSTETGQLAMRRPTQHADWEVYDGIHLQQQNGVTTASGGHLEAPQILNDAVEILGPTRFHLLDRHANMVNIGGKRSSLAFLNHTLMQVPGIQDAEFWLPPVKDSMEVSRLVAFVVAPGLQTADILQALRGHLDPVFLPRPIMQLAALPRDGNGKLSQRVLQALAEAHLRRRPAP